MTALKLTTIGTSTGTVIPKEMLARLKAKTGDTLYAIETPEGYLLTPHDPTIDEQFQAGKKLMKDYRDTFQASPNEDRTASQRAESGTKASKRR